MSGKLDLMALTAVWLAACSADSPTVNLCMGDGCSMGSPAGGAAGSAGRSIGNGFAGSGAPGSSETFPIGGRSGSSVADTGGLSVHVRDAKQLKITLVALTCAGDCADIEAVASGGNPPYRYSWEDGSEDAKRHVCLDVSKSLRITATDTAIVAAEFGYAAQTASADVQATVMACSDAGAPPPTTSGCMQATASATCKLANGAMLPEDITVKLIDEAQYFAGGADLPAGRYRLTYLDGCFSYGEPITTIGWTVHAVKAAGFGCWLIDADGLPTMPTPGTEGATIESGSFETYAKCVAANCDQAPLDFDFAGGKLGVARNGGTALAEFDDKDGSTMGGRGPTFRLSRLDSCP